MNPVVAAKVRGTVFRNKLVHTMKNQSQVTINAAKFSRTFTIRKGLGFQALSAKNETPIEYDCREADCGVCIVRVISGMNNLSAKTESEDAFLQAMRADEDERLTCQCRIMGDVVVEVEGD